MDNTERSKSNRKRISQTHFDRKPAHYLNQTIYGGLIFEITRYGKIAAELSPKSEEMEQESEVTTK